jgi:hypothetical protein
MSTFHMFTVPSELPVKNDEPTFVWPLSGENSANFMLDDFWNFTCWMKATQSARVYRFSIFWKFRRHMNTSEELELAITTPWLFIKTASSFLLLIPGLTSAEVSSIVYKGLRLIDSGLTVLWFVNGLALDDRRGWSPFGLLIVRSSGSVKLGAFSPHPLIGVKS